MIESLAAIVLIALSCAAVIKAYNVLSGRNLVLDAIDKLKLGTRGINAWDSYWQKNPQRSDIVICLTTIPSRLPYIDATLKSLLYQTRAPARIRLHLPRISRRENVAYDLPKWLSTLSAVEIVSCDDYGPATKLIPALYDEPKDRKLLIVDDDKLYPPNLVENFDKLSEVYPDVALGSSGWVVPTDLTDRPVTLLGNYRGHPPARIKATRIDCPTPIDIIQGHSSYLVRPRFFDVDKLVADYANAPPAAFYVDDVWISGYCTAEKFVLPSRRFCFISYWRNRHYDATSLENINSRKLSPDCKHNTIMIRHLRHRWLISRAPA